MTNPPAAVNPALIAPLAECLVRNHDRRVLLAGSDYIHPRESNRIMRDLIESCGGSSTKSMFPWLWGQRSWRYRCFWRKAGRPTNRGRQPVPYMDVSKKG
jgi:hypothetical protein